MSQADISTTLIRSRRAVLAGIASAAALPIAGATPTTALAAAPAIDPAFALIAAKRAADNAHGDACDAQSAAEKRYGFNSDEADVAFENGTPACHAAMKACWPLATIPPTTLAGVAAVLRFANEIEDAGHEWPDTDTVGSEGWHYHLRATMAEAVEALIKAGKAAQS